MDEERDQNLEGQEDPISVSGEKSMGLILGTIIVVIILVVAAFYFLSDGPEGDAPLPVSNDNPIVVPEDNSNDNTGDAPVDSTGDEVPTEDNSIETLEDLGTTDEVDEIIADLEATQMDDLGTELNDLGVEFEL
ncbi:hypothetical protein KJ973_03710 [Patescibacteria group bacterium]|nr:hypothetical protein [Patescibacteria group bacterium]MBU1519767.1 hypothetical protein [Patescibacteria group bacterium]MBU1730363.1 hypothetical protein [Patescibacteria group bacterium]MBU2010473.1 hypothetical protein [Patescibacteria group bacterium]MBU2416826.1 hypothetical protein [Patescibacteria group bacterium]